MKYVDKTGEEIKEGYVIDVGDGKPEKVYKCSDQYGAEDLGINASNEEYLKRHPYASREYYPLSNFAADSITILDRGEVT